MYFDDCTDEGELKERYRKLMIENHFESPYRDEELVNAIFQEYTGRLRKIMCSRGYRSPLQKAAAMAKKLIKEAKARKKQYIREIMGNKEEKLSKRIKKAYKVRRSAITLWIEEE